MASVFALPAMLTAAATELAVIESAVRTENQTARTATTRCWLRPAYAHLIYAEPISAAINLDRARI